MKIYIKKYKILFNKLIMFNLINIIYLFSKAKNFVFYKCYVIKKEIAGIIKKSNKIKKEKMEII